MDNDKFFRDNLEKLIEELYKRGDIFLAGLDNIQKDNIEVVLDKISRVLLDYNISHDVMVLTKGEISKEFNSIGKTITDNVKNEFDNEDKKLYEILNSVAEDRYNMNSYLMSLGISFKLLKVSNKVLEEIISKTIDGKNYSDRLWENKNEIAKLLQKDVKDFLEGKISVNEIKQKIRKRYNANRYNTERLVINEIARVQEEVNSVWMEEHDIEWVMRSETLDMKTCKKCASEDSKKYKRKDIPYQSMHVCCRGTWIALPSKDYVPRTRRDNDTKEIINYKTYQEWKKENNL